MKDSEFYSVSEEWPQPPDDSCTLQDLQTRTIARPKKKSSGRVRKKMSESLAGITAAAVAVVMVTSTISPKDFFRDDVLEDIYEDIFVPTTSVVDVQGERCSICGERGCPYFILPEGMEGLRISYTEEPEHLEYDMYAMNGFTTQDMETCMYAPAIYTETDERLMLRLLDGIHDLLGVGIHWRPLIDNPYVWGDEEIGISGFTINFEDEKSINDTHVVHVYLAYSPSGVCAADDIAQSLGMQAELAALQFSASEVVGVENAEIHVYSDLGEEFNQSVMECCFVETFTEPDGSFTLGETMRLQEGTVVHRNFDDGYYFGYCEWISVSKEKGETWAFEADFHLKAYSINDMTITFAATSWLDLLAQWEDLNDLAPKYGHQVCFPLYYLGETSANGITYRCYATYVADASEDHYVTYLVVPQQEQEILISFTEYFYDEEMEALLSGKLEGDNIAQTYEIFSQITLR